MLDPADIMIIKDKVMVKEPASSTASGIRCKKAPPNNVPTERLTKDISNLFSFFLLNNNVKIPKNETKDTKITLIKI